MKNKCIIRTSVIIAMFLMSVMTMAIQKPGEKVRGGAITGEQYQTQEAHDAVQDINIETLKAISAANAENTQAIRDKMNLVLGGVGGFGGLLTFLQIYQIRRNDGPNNNGGNRRA